VNEGVLAGQIPEEFVQLVDPDELDEGVDLRDVVSERTLEIVDSRRVAKPHRRGWLVRRLLLAADLAGLVVAFLIAELVTAGTSSGRFGILSEAILFAATLPCWVLIARMYGLYSQDDQRTNHVTTDEVANVFNMVTVCTWLFFAFSWLSGAAQPDVRKLLVFWTLAVVLLPIARTLGRGFARTRRSFIQNTIIVGAGQVGQTVAEKLLRHPEYGVNVVGFVDVAPKKEQHWTTPLPLLGEVDDLERITQTFDVERVVFAFPRGSHDRILRAIRSLKDAFIQVDIVPRFFELAGPTTGISAVEGIPVLCLPTRGLGNAARLLKRTMDIAVSAVALFVLSPLFCLVALLIKLDSPGPVLFRQRRVGAGGDEFQILKFRTMVRDADGQKGVVAHLNEHGDGDCRMFKIRDDPRVTRVGHVLRRLSIDELPQLLNVLEGTMSLVGPRPLIPSEDEYVLDWARERLALRPGMTGLWQVLGRSEIPFEEMVRLDYIYVTNWSLWHDLRLICGTVPAMLKGGRGAY
jgi:exopolysaccharide biosynthesis polyprenyl glycosylphosphotransferase